MIGDESCPRCSEALTKRPTYDADTNTMRYKCLNTKCGYVHVTEPIAERKKKALKLTQRDIIRLRRGLW